MTHIIMPTVYCPLCDEPFKKQRVSYHGHIITLFRCLPCNIFTLPQDPSFNRWRDSDKVIPCPHCNTPVKWFLRYGDQYMKMKCPKCKLQGEGDCNAWMNPDGTMNLEQMKQDEGEEVGRIEVPVDKLRLPQEQREGIKKKIRENRRKKEHGNG